MITTIIQIFVIPVAILLLTWLLTKITSGKLAKKVGYTVFYAVANYIVQSIPIFSLWFIFKPIKIGDQYHLQGGNLWGFWISAYIISFLITILFSHLYFNKIKTDRFLRDAALFGLCIVMCSMLFEISIYVYWRKTILSIHDYFFGKNYPWMIFNWIIVIIAPFLTAFWRNSRKRG